MTKKRTEPKKKYPKKDFSKLKPIESGKYQTLKIQLKYLVNGPGLTEEESEKIMQTIKRAVDRVNIIVERGYQLSRAYLLNCYDNSEDPFPDINPEYFSKILTTVTKRGSETRKSKHGEDKQKERDELKESIVNFYDTMFAHNLQKKSTPDGRNLSYILRYETKRMAVAYENNMRMRFPAYLKRFIFAKFGFKKKKYRNVVNKIYNDLVCGSTEVFQYQVESNFYQQWLWKNAPNIDKEKSYDEINNEIQGLLRDYILTNDTLKEISTYIIDRLKNKSVAKNPPQWIQTWVRNNINNYSGLTKTAILKHLKADLSEYVAKPRKTTFLKQMAEDAIQIRDTPALRYKYKSDKKYWQWIDYYRPILLPEMTKNFHYDIKSEPLKFIEKSIFINRELEKLGAKLFQPLCLRDTFVPCHVTFDTAGIVDCLTTSELFLKISEKNPKFRTKDSCTKDINECKRAVWSTLFPGLFFGKKKCMLGSRYKRNRSTRKKRKAKKKKCPYTFNDMITTDGYEVCVLRIDRRFYSQKYGMTEMKRGEKKIERLTELKNWELEKLKHEKLVGCDPGIGNILQVTDRKKSVGYTSAQRRVETKQKKNDGRREKIISEADPRFQEENDRLTLEDKKTCSLKKFLRYVNVRSRMDVTREHYKKISYRKMNYSNYVSTRESEAKYIKKLKETFPGVKTMLYGDWSRDSQMKYTRPVPGRGHRRMLIRNGYRLLLTGEYLTSQVCNTCSCKVSKFMRVDDPRAKGTAEEGQKKIVLHSLLQCENSKCNKVWNRDQNGALNILEVGLQYINYRTRPKPFRR